MRNELQEIKRKIEEGKKKKQLEEKIKSQQKFSKVINSAVSKKDQFEEEKIKTEIEHQRKIFILNLFKTTALCSFLVLSITFASKAVSEPPHPLTILEKKDISELPKIPKLCEQIYNAFRNNDIEQIQKLTSSIDDEWREDCKNLISQMENANFANLKLFSPKANPDVCFAVIPFNKDYNLQFNFFKQNNQIIFTGLALNKK